MAREDNMLNKASNIFNNVQQSNKQQHAFVIERKIEP